MRHDVLITGSVDPAHMHPDHVGGLMAGGAIAFPHAAVRRDKADAEIWLSEANMNAAPKDSQGFIQGAMVSLRPDVDAGELRTFAGNTQLVPDVRSVASHGHTAGHSAYYVESTAETLVLWGDLLHVAAVQFDHPKVSIKFDSDGKNAASERAKA